MQKIQKHNIFNFKRLFISLLILFVLTFSVSSAWASTSSVKNSLSPGTGSSNKLDETTTPTTDDNGSYQDINDKQNDKQIEKELDQITKKDPKVVSSLGKILLISVLIVIFIVGSGLLLVKKKKPNWKRNAGHNHTNR